MNEVSGEGIENVPEYKASQPPPRMKLIVPKRVIQGGFDEKYEDDPYNMDLKGLISFNDYKSAIGKLNERTKPARQKKIDGMLLATGALLFFPLGIWSARRYRQAKTRKKLLHEAIHEFNCDYPTLYMRYNRRPHSCLTIERRIEEFHGPPPREGNIHPVTGLQGSKDVPFEYE